MQRVQLDLIELAFLVYVKILKHLQESDNVFFVANAYIPESCMHCMERQEAGCLAFHTRIASSNSWFTGGYGSPTEWGRP